MPFFVFKLLFAALAIGLVVVAVLLVRQVLRKRQPPAAEPPREAIAEAPPRKAAGLGRKVAAPEPQPQPAEAPRARRRQLQSFVEDERIAAAAEGGIILPTLPVVAEAMPEPDPEPEPEIEAAAEPPAPVEPEPEPDPEPEPVPAATEPDFDAAVLARLEAAFEALEDGAITLDGYRERLLAEQATVDGRIAALQAAGDPEPLEAALAAAESVRWCLDWAAEQDRA